MEYNTKYNIHQMNFIILYMAWTIHEKYNEFMTNDNDNVKLLENMNNPICKMVKRNFNFLDDQWVTSMALAMSIYTSCCV
jgi:high-affinity nickel permease